MPGGFVCSASMKGAPTGVREASLRATPAPQASSRRSSASSTPRTRPRESRSTNCRSSARIFVLKLKLVPKAFGRKLVGEMWLYPDGSRLLELSTKCAPSEAFQVAAESRAFLAQKGLDLGGEQETKTKKALDFFSKALKANGSVAAEA